jgi:DNA invertase Pin-like site-specific DNA recombinase
MVISILGVVAEMERKLIRERQREGIELAKLKGKFLGRKKGTNEDPLKFLSKKKNKHAMELLTKGYKNIEVSRITGLHPQTVSKVKRLI